MAPAELEEFSGIEIGRFLAKKSFETPLDIGATPRCEAIAARGNPIITNRPKHSYTSMGGGVTSVEDSGMEARKIFGHARQQCGQACQRVSDMGHNFNRVRVECRAT